LIWALRGVRQSRRKSDGLDIKELTHLRKLWAFPVTRLGVALALLFIAGLVIYDVPLLRSTGPLPSLENESIIPPDVLELDMSKVGLSEETAGITYFLLNLARKPLDEWHGFDSPDQFGQMTSGLCYNLN